VRHFELLYKPFGERSILIEWPSEINENILQDVLSFKYTLQNNTIELKIEVKSAYNSLLITYDYTIDNVNDKILVLKALYSSKVVLQKSVFRHWKIPVCYDDEFGLDLDDISNQNKLSKQDIIRLHSEAIYTVYFIGFLPGFLYLGGLNEKLCVPRKSTPRLQIKKGSVAIGGNQTGIYPNESPGGWNIIGNSPISFFDASNDIPCFAKAGDKIQCVPISLETFRRIEMDVKAGVYSLESEVFYD
jgi:inhibitor of KinA